MTTTFEPSSAPTILTDRSGRVFCATPAEMNGQRVVRISLDSGQFKDFDAAAAADLLGELLQAIGRGQDFELVIDASWNQ
ncbi:hypothetical protein [Nocardia tengchongensis]|uniref:hypothetical protein n=1 Tax=Nocardia tengchongensis TaxID=2055889 RepID=UPI00364F0ACC